MLVLSIVVDGLTARTGGAPTYNGVALTQAGANAQAVSGETTVELWYLLNPPTGSSLTIHIPDDNNVYFTAEASSYKAQPGYTSALCTADQGTGTGTNPTGPTHTGLAAGDVIVAAIGSGANTWNPSGRTGTQLYDVDDGSYGDGGQYLIKTDAIDTHMDWTFSTSDDWAIFSAVFKEVQSKWKFPTLFSDSGFSYGDYDPGQAAAIAIGCLHIYMKTGDERAGTWARRILDDLRLYRRDQDYGGYMSDRHYGWLNALVLQTFGLGVNGVPGQSYRFPAITEDKAHFDALISWIMARAGDEKPNVLNSDLIPFTFSEAGDMWSYAPNYLAMGQMGSLEAVVLMLGGALEHGKLQGDWDWFNRLLAFMVRDNLVVLARRKYAPSPRPATSVAPPTWCGCAMPTTTRIAANILRLGTRRPSTTGGSRPWTLIAVTAPR